MLPAPRTSSRTVVFTAMCLAMFMVSVESTIVATALPTIVADLGGLRYFSWLFGAYLLTQVVLIPIYGRLADFFGRKVMLTIGIVIFLAGSILCGFAHTMLQLILFRALQGIGGGGVQPVTVTIVGDLFQGHERARAQAYLSTIWGVSAIAGPIAGAFIVAHLGWPFIFWINVPFGIACVIVMAAAYKEKIPHVVHQIDYLGSALLALGVGALMFVLVMNGNIPASLSIVLAILSVITIAALLWHETRVPEPMLPLGLYKIKVIVIANASNFLIGAMVLGMTAFLPTYVQGGLRQPAVVAGSVLGSYLAFWTVGSVSGARMQRKFTYREIAGFGATLLVAGTLLLVTLGQTASLALLFAALSAMGTGFGLMNSTFVIATQSAVGWEMRGAASSSNQFARQIGSAIGAAVFAAVFNALLYAKVPDASQMMTQLLDPSGHGRIAAAALARDAVAISDAMHGVYLLLLVPALALMGLVLSYPPGLRTVRTGVPQGAQTQ